MKVSIWLLWLVSILISELIVVSELVLVCNYLVGFWLVVVLRKCLFSVLLLLVIGSRFSSGCNVGWLGLVVVCIVVLSV